MQVIDERIIVAGSGEIGLGQRFKGVVEELWGNGSLRDADVVEQARVISQAAVTNFGSTQAKPGAYSALLALPHGNSAELIEFAIERFQPEVKTAGNWYVSMGSGQVVADPLLGFVRRAYWGDEAPNRQEGVLAAMFVLHLACSMAPTGVAEPIQMAVLAPSPDHRGQLRADTPSRS